MKKAFTIIEVIISVVILSLVGVAILKSAGLNLDYFTKISKKSQASNYITIIANHPDPDFNHLKKSLYDFLEKEYFIDDGDILKILKDTKFKYTQTELKLMLPSMDDENEEDGGGDNPLGVSLKKLSIHSKEGGDYIFVVEPNG